jgi:hypothetical protein
MIYSENQCWFTLLKSTAVSASPGVHREAWFPGGPRIPKNDFFEKREKITKNAKTQKRLN